MKQYYIERPNCRTTTKKEKALALALKVYQYTLVTFDDDYTLADFQKELKTQLEQINLIGHGRDIELITHDYQDFLSFAFHLTPSNGACVGTIYMRPVKNYISK